MFVCVCVRACMCVCLCQCLDLLLSQVCDIILKHSEECVLEASVRVLCALCCDTYTFSGRAARTVSQLLDSTVEKFTTNLSKILQVPTSYKNAKML